MPFFISIEFVPDQQPDLARQWLWSEPVVVKFWRPEKSTH